MRRKEQQPQNTGMHPQQTAALLHFYERIYNYTINWAVTGSVGFALQGMDVEVHDIDIQSDRDGAYAIERLFSEYVTRPVIFSSTERIRSHFGALKIMGVEVEIMGGLQKRLDDGSWEAPVNPRDHRRWVNYASMRVPVLSLEYEYHAYLALGRIEKAERIREYLDS